MRRTPTHPPAARGDAHARHETDDTNREAAGKFTLTRDDVAWPRSALATPPPTARHRRPAPLGWKRPLVAIDARSRVSADDGGGTRRHTRRTLLLLLLLLLRAADRHAVGLRRLAPE